MLRFSIKNIVFIPILNYDLLLLLTVMLFTAAAYGAGLERLTPLPGMPWQYSWQPFDHISTPG